MTAISLVYDDIAADINRLAGRFAARYHLDPDDCQSTANEAFVDAYQSFDPARGDLHKHVCYRVWARLQDWLTTKVRRERRQETPALECLSAQEHFCLPEWLSELSAEAQTVVQLTLGKKRPDEGSVTRLLRDLGWGLTQISSAFREIQEALS